MFLLYTYMQCNELFTFTFILGTGDKTECDDFLTIKISEEIFNFEQKMFGVVQADMEKWVQIRLIIG